ncbi:MAG: hypothetical protein EP305_06240 [Bacteroidetes bacterium]|nr:MAG: hypothetical protein EP305_06240 [Bacteroidota bacterium]
MAGLKFRVLLDSDRNEEVFRDILINDTDNFESFYTAIINAFRFQGEEMASFYVSNDEWDKGHEINLMDMSYGDDDVDGTPNTMKDAIIKDFLEEPDQKFILVYDFMRMWIFLIELIGYEKEGPENPEVILAVGMAPPEDSKQASNEAFIGDDFEGEEEDDEFGMDDFEDGYSEDDFSGFDEYDY